MTRLRNFTTEDKYDEINLLLVYQNCRKERRCVANYRSSIEFAHFLLWSKCLTPCTITADISHLHFQCSGSCTCTCSVAAQALSCPAYGTPPSLARWMWLDEMLESFPPRHGRLCSVTPRPVLRVPPWILPLRPRRSSIPYLHSASGIDLGSEEKVISVSQIEIPSQNTVVLC